VFINALSMRREPFFRLVEITEPYLMRGATGHPNLSPVDVIGLTLMWFTSRLLQKHLQTMFGQTPAVICRELQRGRAALRSALQVDRDGRIEWPDAPTMQRFSDMVQRKRGELSHVFGFMDGVHFPILNPADVDEQNAYYNGREREVTITNVLVFTPDGCIASVRYNCPGSWHDSIVALPIYDVLNNIILTPPPYRIIADSAFVATDRCVTCLTVTQAASATRAAQQMNAAVVSVRQAAEWGMHSLQSVFHRLTLPFPCDVAYNQQVLDVAFRLFNFHARWDGNQTRTVFDPDDVIDNNNLADLIDQHNRYLIARFNL
jgi:hypothetical protein